MSRRAKELFQFYALYQALKSISSEPSEPQITYLDQPLFQDRLPHLIGGNCDRAESISVEEPADYSSRNMQEIIPGVFLGPHSAAKRSRLIELENRGITHIIYVTEDEEIEYPFIVNLNYINLNIADSVHENIKRHFATVIEFINECLELDGKVLVVGTNGISRSATLVIAYVMQKKDYTCKEAYTLVRCKRDCIQPNKGFMEQLNFFETYKDVQSRPATPSRLDSRYVYRTLTSTPENSNDQHSRRSRPSTPYYSNYKHSRPSSPYY